MDIVLEMKSERTGESWQVYVERKGIVPMTMIMEDWCCELDFNFSRKYMRNNDL